MDVGEKDVNVRARLKYGDSFVGVDRFKRVEPGRFDHFNCVQADQQFVFDDEDNGPPDQIIHFFALDEQAKKRFGVLFQIGAAGSLRSKAKRPMPLDAAFTLQRTSPLRCKP
jgi:hypothetical protein